MTKTFGVAALALVTMVSPVGGGTAPGTPEALRISSGAYSGFRYCAQDAPPVATATDPTFAASPPSGGLNPRLRATFEVARPGEPAFVTANRAIENGRVFIYQAPLGTLANGDYRWRLRAEEGRTVSAWTPWCDFKVSLPTP